MKNTKIEMEISIWNRLNFEFWCLTTRSTISWQPVLVVEETIVPKENHRPWDATGKFYHLWL